MNVIDLIFRAVTKDLDAANKKLDSVEQSSKDASKATDGLKKSFDGLAGVGGPIGDVASKVDDLNSSVTSAGRAASAMPPLLLAAAGAAGVLAAVNFAPILDGLGDMAKMMGVNLSQATALDNKLAAFGGLKAFQGDLDKVAKALSRADEESSRAAAAFQFLGINLDSIKSPQEALSLITEKYIGNVQAGNLTLGEQQALILALGPAYKEVMMRQEEAAGALETYNKFAEQGLGITDAGVKAAADFGDANDDLSYMFKIIGSQLVGDIIPAFTGLINALVNSYKNGGLVYGAFQLLRAAADIMMVPIRLLINVFIDLDTAIQTVGKTFNAVYTAISTRSLEPLKNLRTEVSALIAEQEKLKSGPFGFTGTRPGVTAPSTSAPRTGPAFSATAGKDAADALKKAQDEASKRDLERLKRQDEAEARGEAEYQANRRMAESYKAMVDPLYNYTKQLEEVRKLREMGLLTQDQALEAEFKIQDAMGKTIETSKQQVQESSLAVKATEYVAGRISDSIGQAFVSGEFNFKSFLSTVLQGIAQLIIQIGVIEPLMAKFKTAMSGASAGGGWGALLTSLFANGGAFVGGVQKFAKGGVVSSPTVFPMANGAGLMGEAGPEAIMPLRRTKGGALGVVAEGGSSGGTINVNQQVTINGGIDSDARQQQVMAELAKQTKAIVKMTISNEKRAGGMLYK